MTGMKVFIKGLKVTFNYLKEAREGFDRSICAAVVAQAGCTDMAREMMLDPKPGRQVGKPQTLHGFLDRVGLASVRVQYGIVRL